MFLLATCARTQPRGQYTLTLKIAGGKLAVDHDAFTLTSKFRDPRRTESIIRQQVRSALAAIPIPAVSGSRNSTWPDYVDAYVSWANQDPARLDLGSAFCSCFWFAGILTNSPDFGLVLNEDQLDAAGGFVSFSILPPFDAAKVPINLPGLSQPRARTRLRQLRKRLARLNGTLWSSEAIKRAIQPYYANLGLQPQWILQPRNQSIQIIEGQHLASVVLPPDQVPAKDIDRVLWDVLNTRDFRRAMRTKAVWEPGRVIDFRRDLDYADGDEPYVISYRLQELQLLLSGLGYSATLQPSARSGVVPYLDLRIQKGDSQAKNQTHHLAGGFQYNPGQGISALAQAQISQFGFPFADSTFSVQGGGPSGSLWLGDYSGDFLGFDSLKSRLSASLNASSSVERARFLEGAKLDEYRTGGLGTLEWQPFRDLNGYFLLLHLTASHSLVSAGAIQNQNLNTLESGALLMHGEDARIEPSVLFGSRFAHFTITANSHHRFDHWESDITGRFENATRATPLYELPSFGGEGTVRGFRADDAIGQRLWSLQNEVWLPVPGLANWNPANQQIQAIVQQLRLAPFVDVGGAYQTVASQAGLREGLGLGLRLDMRVAVLKFDWAYGFGDAATGGSRGKFYFNIGLNVPY